MRTLCPLHRSTPPDSNLTAPDRRWCATSVDSLGNVQEWEYCHPMCKSGDCAFLLPHDYGNDVLLCQDGTRCLANITGTNGWSCCNDHGGRVSTLLCSCSSHTIAVHSCTHAPPPLFLCSYVPLVDAETVPSKSPSHVCSAAHLRERHGSLLRADPRGLREDAGATSMFWYAWWRLASLMGE
jgi:hypothetical protein